jgi:hypothetical protein
MKKGVLAVFVFWVHYLALAQGEVTFISRVISLEPGLVESSLTAEPVLTIGDSIFANVIINADGAIFFGGTSGSGSSYFTGSGSAALTPSSTASDVRSRSFSGSDYFSSSGQMADTGFALHLGNGVNPLTDSSGRIEVVPDPKPLVIQGGKVKADGSFELSVKGPPHVSFYVEVSTDGKTFTGLTQKALSGSLVVFNTCDENGQCMAIDREAGQSSFRFYRLQLFDTPTAATGN